MLLESFLFTDKANTDWNRRRLLAQFHNGTGITRSGILHTSILA
jgi:hypothetical protein